MLTIHDQEVYWDGPTKKVITGLPMVIRVAYTAVPVLRTDGSVVNENQSAYTLFPVDPVTGYHDTQLLWPSERKGDNSYVQVRRVGGSLYQGKVPEGLTGPVTFDTLLTTYGAGTVYGWQIVAAGTLPAQVVAVQQLPGVTDQTIAGIRMRIWSEL